MHTLTPQRLTQLLESNEARDLSAPARQRLTWIAEFVMNGHSISETCSRLGIARSTFHRWLERFDPEDLSSLEERAHDPQTVRTSGVAQETIALIRTYREKFPLIGKEQIRELLLNEHAIDLSSSTIARVIERECLYFGTTPLHWRKRMQHQKKVAAPMHASAVAEVSPALPARAAAPSIDTQKTDAHAAASCACMWCRVCAIDWRFIRRMLGIASILTNLVFAGTYLATAYWEQQEQSIQAELIPNQATLNDGR